MGLLPEIASGLLPEMMATRPDVGLARAGWAISAYAVGVVIGAPLLSLLAVRLSRARLIVVFATLLAVSTLASGIMPSFELTIAARFLAGLPHGRSEEHTSELQSRGHLVCRLLLEKKKTKP